MRKDIPITEVKNVGIAVIEELNEEKTDSVYNVYLINLQDKILKNVLVSSRGYGQNKSTGESVKTSVLRHSLGDVAPKSFIKIEPIIKEVFGLNNEYWLSYYEGTHILDKKYIFLAETIQDKNFIEVPIINKSGVFIK